MSWILEDWRLKLLALGLAMLMLGAVAFSQNPPTRQSLTIGLNYDTASDIVILNPPSKTTVTYTGLADAIGLVNTSNLTATVDATHAKPGSAVKLPVNAATSVPGVNVLNPASIVVNIDTRATATLTVTVQARYGGGYGKKKEDTTCGGVTPCVVHFTGPQSWEDAVGLKAVVIYPTLVQSTEISQPSQPITLLTNTGPFDTTRVTQPSWSLDISSADIHILATPGFTSNTVPLIPSPNVAQPPPPGYQVTNISVSPAFVVVVGDPTAIAKNPRIVLPAVDLSSATSTVIIQVNIPYPEGITPLNGVETAKVTYTIQRTPGVTTSASPSP